MDPRLTPLYGFEGIHLVADVWGADRDWPVLLMHGGGQTRHAWGNTAESLARNGWRAVSLDLRGHGDSEWALNGDYSFTAYGADCIAVVDQLGRAPVLVGASLGGITAMLAEGGSSSSTSRIAPIPPGCSGFAISCAPAWAGSPRSTRRPPRSRHIRRIAL